MNTATFAIDLARSALLESIPADHVGKALDSVVEPTEDSSVTITSYTFECTSPGYPGWYWEVSLIEVNGQAELSVSEVNLLPGSAALVPEQWKPWADRVEAGEARLSDLITTYVEELGDGLAVEGTLGNEIDLTAGVVGGHIGRHRFEYLDGFDVVDQGGGAPEPGLGRVGGTGAGHAPLALD